MPETLVVDQYGRITLKQIGDITPTVLEKSVSLSSKGCNGNDEIIDRDHRERPRGNVAILVVTPANDPGSLPKVSAKFCVVRCPNPLTRTDFL